MIRKPRSIRSILFLTYSSIIVIGIVLLFVLFYLWSSNVLKTNASNSISELSSSLQNQLDLEVQKLDSVSVSIMYSNLITDRISAYETTKTDNLTSGSTEQSVRINTQSTDLYDILVALVGPSYPVQQVYLHLLSGVSIGVGFDNSQKKLDITSKPWFAALNDNRKMKVLTLSTSSNGSVSLNNNDVSLSLSRYFYDKYNAPVGIVEVKQNYNKVFSSFIQLAKDNPSLEKVFIYSTTGEVIFPYDSSEQDRQIVNHILHTSNNFSSDQRTYFSDPITKNKVLLTIKHSELTNWNVAVMISNKTFLAPLNKFTKLAIFVTLAILVFLIILSYFASKRITSPLSSLNRTIKSISLESLVSGPNVELNSGLNEWDRLNASFVKMNARLKDSFDQLLLSRTQELQAKMTALQSQMNPHFLYNSLATISAMAYEQLHEQIIIMCDNLSDMMRYIAADETSLVDIQTEVDYTEMYVTCMKLRYGDMLSYTIDLDASIQQVQIPKIMIQPLVENALKYGTKTSPPWVISVSGRIVGERWIIEVMDNGPGFDEQELSRFYAEVREIERNNVLPSLKLHGMGLLNIYIRLKLHYNNQMLFKIRNLPDRGAIVTIGGPLSSKR